MIFFPLKTIDGSRESLDSKHNVPLSSISQKSSLLPPRVPVSSFDVLPFLCFQFAHCIYYDVSKILF